MSGKNGIILTESQVATWLQDKAKAIATIKAAQETLASINRKIEAAEIITGAPIVATVPATSADQAPDRDDDGDADSAANLLCADMRASGASLKVGQIRIRLMALGFADKIADKPNYVYGLAHRLTKTGKLIKRGSKYRASPIPSSQEETGVLGTPARQ